MTNSQLSDEITHRDPDRAFNQAIEIGVMSTDPESPHFAGNFMYMFTKARCDYFKHKVTRRYFYSSMDPAANTEQPSQQAPATILENWVVYHNPADHPGKWVIRRWAIQQGNPEPVPTTEAYVADSYAEVAARIPDGLTNIGRSPGDVAAILEVWL